MTDVHSSVKKQTLDVNPLALFGSILLTLLLQMALCCWCENPDTDIVGSVECMFDKVLCLSNWQTVLKVSMNAVLKCCSGMGWRSKTASVITISSQP